MQPSYLIVGAKSSTLPVPLAELKAHLSISGTSDDARITALEWAAVDFVERQLNRYLVTTSVTEVYQRFPLIWDRQAGYNGNLWNPWPFTNTPSGMPFDWGRWQKLELSRSPVNSITSLSYYDTNNVLQTLTQNTDYYALLPTDRPGFIQPITAWPFANYRPDAVQLVYNAGYSVLPGVLNAAVKLLVGAWNENREDFLSNATMIPSVPIGVDAMIQSIATGGYY
jgi:hypothetical protein